MLAVHVIRPGMARCIAAFATCLTLAGGIGAARAAPASYLVVADVVVDRPDDAPLGRVLAGGLVEAAAGDGRYLVLDAAARDARLVSAAEPVDCRRAGLAECAARVGAACGARVALAARLVRAGRTLVVELVRVDVAHRDRPAVRSTRPCNCDAAGLAARAGEMVREVLGTPGPAPPLRAEVEAGAVAEALSGDGVSAPVLRRRAAGLVVGAAGAGEVPVPAGSAIVGMAPAEAAEAADLCQDTRTEECREEWFDAAVPRRVVEVPGFFVDRTEVTHGDYARCVEAGGCAATGVIGVDVEPELPVTDVTLEDARRYCRWAGKRLPTEVEWEKAARGSDGRHYPWGNLTEDDCARAAWGRGPLAPLCKGHGDNSPAAVGDFPRGASPYGALDMAGNVWEWVEPDPRTPLPPDMGVARGGAYYLDAAVMRSAFRLFQESEERYAHTGFRCARSFAPAPPVSAPPASAPPGPDQGK